jgi:serine/threonine protein phosphatase PrpC
MEHVIVSAPEKASGQDRAVVIPRADGLVVALADGAGGASNGALAAQAVVDVAVRGDPADVILACDEHLRNVGLTTAIIVHVRADAVSGASVGDSAAWLIDGEVIDLTEHQRRKPLVGGGCVPVAFRSERPLGTATLLVASDGLFSYAAAADIARVVRAGRDLRETADALVELVRLPSGGLQDDVTIVLCRAHG